MRIVQRPEIEAALVGLDLLPAIEAGFVAWSEGRAVIPPVGELVLPKGEVHIKYGYIAGGARYVIKIASGFYANPARGLPTSQGMMLLFDQATGLPEAMLLDEGHLTDIRTAVAGAIAARHLAVQPVRRIGILGSGVQARLQLRHLAAVTECRTAALWGRTPERVEACRRDMAADGFDVTIMKSPAELAAACDLIVTTTPALAPLLSAADIRPGTHITAIGSDTEQKRELDPGILARADVVVVDSHAQSRLRGEVAHALRTGAIREDRVVELGAILSGQAAGRRSDAQISVFDSTGVAVQDLQIATAVLDRLTGESGA